MKLEVGMYVRTKYEGIFIISHINTNFADDDYSKVCLCQNEKVAFTSVDTINQLNFSNNIVDLIEVGDYVNGGQVREKKEDYIRISGGNFMFQYLKENEIKSIVTKEEFESIKYSLEG